MLEISGLTRQFLRHELGNKKFGHREHLKVAYDLLNAHEFDEAATLYASAIRSMAKAAGHRQKLNATITLAFLSLTAERKSLQTQEDFESFIHRNPDLLERDCLASWYSTDRLHSDRARRVFLLPDRHLPVTD